jgi:L-lactate dehydrogenase (cytochrome)
MQTMPSQLFVLTLNLDVLKALCLGARAVGLGRAFLYAQSVSPFTLLSCSLNNISPHRKQAYGAAGVTKLVHILQREIVTGMQFLGARNVGELVPEMVCLIFGHCHPALMTDDQ